MAVQGPAAGLGEKTVSNDQDRPGCNLSGNLDILFFCPLMKEFSGGHAPEIGFKV